MGKALSFIAMPAAFLLIFSAGSDVARGEARPADAVEIALAYIENPNSADSKYGRQPLKISGLADNFSLSANGLPAVSFKGGSKKVNGSFRSASITCHLARHQQDELTEILNKMVKGEKVAINGRLQKTGLKGRLNIEPGLCVVYSYGER